MRCIVAGLIALTLTQPAAAQQIDELTGSAEDKQAFQTLVSKCETLVGTPFSGLVAQLILEEVPLRLARSAQSSAYLFGSFAASGGVHEVNLDHILALPEATRAASSVTYPTGVPNWATTQCVALTHELAEAHYAYVESAEFGPSHRYAIGKENQVRRSLGHRRGSPVMVTVTYEVGSDLPCNVSNYEASLR